MTRPQVPAEWPAARIVIIDDEAPILRMLERLLMSTGYEDVRTFADPREAIAGFVDLAPDLTILDLHMPGMHGTEVLRRLNACGPDPRAPVVVMTGAGRSGDVHRTLAMGAADFLHKPVDAVELLLRVRHQLRERRLRQELASQNRQLERSAAARAGELALLSRVLDDIPVMTAVLEPDLRLRYANALARELLEPGSTDLTSVLATDPSQIGELEAFLGAAVTSQPARRQWTLRRPHGGLLRVEIEAKRLGDDLIAVLIHDVEDQQRATDALHRGLKLEQRANEDLRELEDLRTHFLGAVSHELRTPLTVVLGVAESLERHHDVISPARRLDLLGRLHRNAQRLGRLLDDLLDLNRLVIGQLEARPERHDLARIVAEAVAECELGSHPLTVEVASVELEVEAPRIQRVVANLVRNAVVHTPSRTPIRIDVQEDAAWVRLRVIDHGPGVPDVVKRRIFAPFEQGPSIQRHQPGTGIGLSLVSEFVRLHDGRTWVEDTPGGGATFVVELPRHGPSTSTDPSHPAEPSASDGGRFPGLR